MSDIHALSGAYAVDALDDVERARFEQHLGQCAACREEVSTLRDTAALLAGEAATEPPSGLRDAVLASARTVRPLPPVTTAPTAPRPRRVPALLAAAAALIAIGAVGVTIWHPWSDQTTQSQAGPAERLENIAGAADVERVEQQLPRGGTATVVRSRSLDAVAIRADLPPAPSGHFYELWFNIDGEMVPAGRLDGPSTVLDGEPGQAERALGVAISIEPEGVEPISPTTVYGAPFTFA